MITFMFKGWFLILSQSKTRNGYFWSQTFRFIVKVQIWTLLQSCSCSIFLKSSILPNISVIHQVIRLHSQVVIETHCYRRQKHSLRSHLLFPSLRSLNQLMFVLQMWTSTHCTKVLCFFYVWNDPNFRSSAFRRRCPRSFHFTNFLPESRLSPFTVRVKHERKWLCKRTE